MIVALAFVGSSLLLPWYVTAVLAIIAAPLRGGPYALVLGGLLMDISFGPGMPYLYTAIFSAAAVAAAYVRAHALG